MMRAERTSAGASNAWLATFTDLAALILAFFVLTFSMLVLRDEDWKPPQGRDETTLPFDAGIELPSVLDHVAEPDEVTTDPNDRYLQTVLNDRLSSLGLVDRYEIVPGPRGLDIILYDIIMANAGGWTLDPAAPGVIDLILSSARGTGRKISILTASQTEGGLEQALSRSDAILEAVPPATGLDILIKTGTRRTDAVGFRLERE